MLILKSLAKGLGEPSVSPFCVKVMCLLRLSGLDWRADYDADPRKTPKGKLPVLVDGDEVIADSAAIRAHLERRAGVDFDEGLDAAARGRAHALTRMMEEHYYFHLVSERWLDEDAWPATRAAGFANLPPVVRSIVPLLVRRDLRRAMHGQGAGRYSKAERGERCAADLDAVAAALGEKAFLFADAPTAADASVAPLVSSSLNGAENSVLRRAVEARPALVAYAERARTALYPA